ncbi:GT2 family glycosyltransferase [Algoriphagus ratkowskyi]|uniref:GT2 family glycosyltransferase n=1 Tax=Algoriphagus ratkowskyi TaxID=57028 RepID=A0A2W7QNA7_9BACT|nr:glycosyltransferase [Algoriphagus ratkowskyi]PZX49804.1 GT2 family glycosyltransferase [Algoriphagus ratkowskyi]TXD75476.1 glycosyltransferase family 2 protein [Algoriphagus ratkowskyi]
MNSGISIIICSYNGTNRLSKTLDSILIQDTRSPFELIVVDNNSTDETSVFAKTFLSRKTIDWRLIHEAKAGLSHARWRGIAEAKYELILFCDDDNHLESNYLEIGNDFFKRNPNVGILGGLGRAVFESEKPIWFDHFAHSYAVGTLGKQAGVQAKGSYHYGASCFIRRLPLMKLREKGFQSVLSDRKGSGLSSGGDVELCYAVQLLGYDLAFEPALRFDHYIENHRLKWSYYLNLKRGIASSFPLLDTYEIDQMDSSRNFQHYLWRRLWMVVKGIIKTFPTRNSSLQNQVTFAILRSKLKAFRINYMNALLAFERNKRIFGE